MNPTVREGIGALIDWGKIPVQIIQGAVSLAKVPEKGLETINKLSDNSVKIVDSTGKTVSNIGQNVENTAIGVTQNIEDTAIGVIVPVSHDVKDTTIKVSGDIKEEFIVGATEIGKSERQNVEKVTNSVNTLIKWESLIWLSGILIVGYIITNKTFNKTLQKGQESSSKIMKEFADVSKEAVKQTGETSKKVVDAVKENPEIASELTKALTGSSQIEALGNITENLPIIGK